MNRRTKAIGSGVLSAVVAASFASTSAASAAPRTAPSAAGVSHTVVVTGLNNPRQLALVDNVELLIAEAGKGGATQVGSGDDAQFIGKTGSVSAVILPQLARNTRPVRVVTGLVSASSAGGLAAVGPDGVTARRPLGPIYAQQTSAPPDVLPSGLPSAQNGQLLKAKRFGSVARPFADITGYENANDPDGQGASSDPYAVLAVGNGFLVADAAGNDVLRVTASGHISVFHLFANITTGPCVGQADPTPDFPGCNFVPDALAQDRWGHIFVGALGSEVPGAGRVVELDRNGHYLNTWTGFTSVDGVAVGWDGSLYVSQLEAQESNPIPLPPAPGGVSAGVLTKISPSGKRTNVDVPFPGGVAADRQGNVYVAAYAIAPGSGVDVPGVNTSGQVWRLRI